PKVSRQVARDAKQTGRLFLVCLASWRAILSLVGPPDLAAEPGARTGIRARHRLPPGESARGSRARTASSAPTRSQQRGGLQPAWIDLRRPQGVREGGEVLTEGYPGGAGSACSLQQFRYQLSAPEPAGRCSPGVP